MRLFFTIFKHCAILNGFCSCLIAFSCHLQLLIEHKEAHNLQAGENEVMTQEESDDYILIDGDGSVGNLDAWGTIWYAFTTESLKRPPMDFKVLNSSETKVTFQWRKDQCVKMGYSLIYNSFNGK